MTDYDTERQERIDPDHTDAEWLREQYADGNSQLDIAETCGVHKGTIQYWMEKHGIERRSSSGRDPDAAPRLTTDVTKGYEQFWADGVKFKHHKLVAIAGGADPHDAFRPGYDVHHGADERFGPRGVEVPWANWPANVEVLTHAEHARRHATHVDKLYAEREFLEREYVEKRRASVDIGEQFGVTHATILNWLEYHGIPRR